MSTYAAKGALLHTMGECMHPGCGCFTDKGYYIQYKKGNVDCLLFVCSECFETYYKVNCSMESFDETSYIRTKDRQRYQRVNPVWAVLSQGVGRFSKFLRYTAAATSVVLILAFSIKEQPKLREEYKVPGIHFSLNKGLHYEVRDMKNIEEQWKAFGEKLDAVLSHGGKWDDH